MALCSGLKP